jgi:hypothetical protein
VGTINEEMRRVVEEQRLGYAARYRFKGTGMVLTEGDLFDETLEFYRERGSSTRSGPSCSWRWSGPCRSHPLPTTRARHAARRRRTPVEKLAGR